MKTDLFDSRRWSSRGDVRRRRPRDSATGTTGTAAGSCCPAIQKFKIILLLATKVPPVGLVRQVKLLTKPQEFQILKKGEWKGICIRAIRRLKTALGGKNELPNDVATAAQTTDFFTTPTTGSRAAVSQSDASPFVT